MTNADLTAALDRVNAATTGIGNDIAPIAAYEKSLADQLAAGMTSEEQTAAAAKLSANADALEAAGTALVALGGPAPVVPAP